MILTGITASMIEKAIREEPLLHNFIPPKRAVEEVAKAMWEHELATWCEWEDEQKRWDELPKGAKELALKNATWLLGRLKHARFIVIADPRGRY